MQGVRFLAVFQYSQYSCPASSRRILSSRLPKRIHIFPQHRSSFRTSRSSVENDAGCGSPVEPSILLLRRVSTNACSIHGLQFSASFQDGSLQAPKSRRACCRARHWQSHSTDSISQSEYADFFFDTTNTNGKTALKAKFARICKNSGINQRYFHCTEEVLKANPAMCTYKDASLDIRQDIAIKEVPRLAAKAAEKALKEWGQPREQITHVVFATTSGVNMPGADLTLTRLLGLNPTVNRTMLYQQGCFGGATVLRVAKDLAENNKGARVLTVVSELTCVTFRAPNEEHLDNLVGSAIFGDGASVLVIGSDPVPKVEKPLYEIHWSAETILPESDGAIEGRLTEAGLIFHLLKDVPGIISRNTLPIFNAAASQMTGTPGWNDIFWCVHPGGRAILDGLEKALSLKPEKLKATRDVLYDYGNMSGASVLFVLDQMRNLSAQKNSTTTGEGAEWGIVVAFGPGLTVEVSVLKAISTAAV